MLIEITEATQELNSSVISMKFSQRAKNSDLKDLAHSQHETAFPSPGMNRLKLLQSLLNDIIGDRTKVIPRDGVLEPPGYLATLLERRPDISQDVRVDTLIGWTGIRNLLLQGAVGSDTMSAQHTAQALCREEFPVLASTSLRHLGCGRASLAFLTAAGGKTENPKATAREPPAANHAPHTSRRGTPLRPASPLRRFRLETDPSYYPLLGARNASWPTIRAATRA